MVELAYADVCMGLSRVGTLSFPLCNFAPLRKSHLYHITALFTVGAVQLCKCFQTKEQKFCAAEPKESW